jgi:hypothetical protein
MKKIENIALSCFFVFMFYTLNASAKTDNSVDFLNNNVTSSSKKNVFVSSNVDPEVILNKNSEKNTCESSDHSEKVKVDTIGDNIPDSVAHFDWTHVMNGIIQVESNGNPKAVSGLSVGVMQITPVLVSDCNRILRRRRSKKRFSLRDRWSVSKSKEMFLIFQSFYNPLNDIERAIRSWNGGSHFSIKRTQYYLEKVLAAMKAL